MGRRSSSYVSLLCVALLLALAIGALTARQDTLGSGSEDSSTLQPAEVHSAYKYKHPGYGTSREHYPAADGDRTSHGPYDHDYHHDSYDRHAHKGSDFDGPHYKDRNYGDHGYHTRHDPDKYLTPGEYDEPRRHGDDDYYFPKERRYYHPKPPVCPTSRGCVGAVCSTDGNCCSDLQCWGGTCQHKLPTTIGGVVCPTRVVDVPVGSNLSHPEYSRTDVTYRLSAGNYTVTSQVEFPEGSFPFPVCYVGASSDTVTINLQLSTFAYPLRARNVQLGLQGLTLDGQGQAGGVSVDDFAAFAANQVVFRGCHLGALLAVAGAGSVVLTSTSFTGCGSSTTPAVLMRSSQPTSWLNVNFFDNLGGALECGASSSFSMLGTNIFMRNTGGPALLVVGGCNLRLASAEFQHNTFEGDEFASGFSTGDGGAISVNGGGNLRLTGEVLVDSNSCSQSGGGMYVSSGADVTFAPSSVATFSNNTADLDGGALSMTSGSFVTFEANSVATFLSNTARRNGGAISISSGAFLVLSEASMARNVATGNGGAVCAQSGARLVLSAASMAQNLADLGGALYMSSGARTNVQPGGSFCISDNTASTKGGGVYMDSGGADLTLGGDDASQVMGGNTPDALVVVDGATFTCTSDGFERGSGNTTFRIYAIDGGAICSCPLPPAPTDPLDPDSEGTTICPSCPNGQQWDVDTCSCV